MDKVISLIERGWIPDSLIRTGIRQLLRKRLSEEKINFNAGDHCISFSLSFKDFQNIENPWMAKLSENV